MYDSESPIDDGMDPEVVARAMQLFDFLHIADDIPPEGYQEGPEEPMLPEDGILLDLIMAEAARQCISFEEALAQYKEMGGVLFLMNKAPCFQFDITPLEGIDVSILEHEKG